MSETLEAVLQYLRQENTDYAYMLTGPWGAGKTHFWKHEVVPAINTQTNEFGDEKPTVIYVSLYGVSTVEEIEAAVLGQAHPTLMKAGKVMTVVGRSALKFFRLDPLGEHVEVSKWLSKLVDPKALIICFDDLERAEMPLSGVLGFLNQFVEHVSAKVIILCNEDEIILPGGIQPAGNQAARVNEYLRTKEKVVRVTRKFALDDETVVTTIIDEFKTRVAYHEYLTSHKAHILQLFRDSQLNNLRILKYGLGVLQTAFEVVEELAPDAHEHKARLIWSLLPVTFDRQSVRLTDIDAHSLLTGGVGLIYVAAFGGNDEKATPIGKLVARYRLADHIESLIPSEATAQLVTSGYLDRQKLRMEIEQERAAQSPGQIAVRRLTNTWYDLDDTTYFQLLADSLRAVRAGEVPEWSGMMQLARVYDSALRNGFGNASLTDIKSAYEEGINILTTGHRFQRKESWLADHEIMIMNGDGDLVRWVRDYILVTNKQLESDAIAQKVRDAFDAIADDAIDFARWITGREDTCVATMAMADFVTSAAFADKAMKTSNAAKRQLAAAIRERYQHELNRPRLISDRPWLDDVENRLQHWLDQHKAAKVPSVLIMRGLICDISDAKLALDASMPPTDG